MIEVKVAIKGQSRDALVEALREAIIAVQDEGIEIDMIKAKDGAGATAEGEVEIIDFELKKKDLEEQAGYALSDNQVRFCVDAENNNQELRLDYSGRGMYGQKCPAVTVDDVSEFTTTAKYRTDSMGLGVVMYAQR